MNVAFQIPHERWLTNRMATAKTDMSVAELCRHWIRRHHVGEGAATALRAHPAAAHAARRALYAASAAVLDCASRVDAAAVADTLRDARAARDASTFGTLLARETARLAIAAEACVAREVDAAACAGAEPVAASAVALALAAHLAVTTAFTARAAVVRI